MVRLLTFGRHAAKYQAGCKLLLLAKLTNGRDRTRICDLLHVKKAVKQCSLQLTHYVAIS